MLKKFQNHINQNLPFLKESKLLLAVSGGMDSMVLLHLCKSAGFQIAVVHCNFQLRGEESDEDEIFVKNMCNDLRVFFYVTRFETESYAEQQKLSIQVVARQLRYDYFHTVLINNDYDYVLTAHHLNDSMETFLINFTRGTGLEGLTGIPEQNEKVVRAMLPFSKIDIEQYALQNNISWRDDSSNETDKYQRNKYRHKVIPILQEQNSNLFQSFQNTLDYLKQAQSMVEDASDMVYSIVVEEEETIKINLSKLLTFKNHKAYLYQWLYKYGFTAWNDIYHLVHGQSGKQVLCKHYILLKDRTHLILFPKHREEQMAHFWINKEQLEVKFPIKLSLCKADNISNVNRNTIFADEEKLQFPLQIRKWQEGDVFFPFGMEGSKKLSKYFKDEKFSILDKVNTWLLCSNNKIVWIIGNRQDSRFKITEETTKILKINYTN
ncbi:tRNA lysidine(34) synthetase TilS [Flavobacterium sp.]